MMLRPFLPQQRDSYEGISPITIGLPQDLDRREMTLSVSHIVHPVGRILLTIRRQNHEQFGLSGKRDRDGLC